VLSTGFSVGMASVNPTLVNSDELEMNIDFWQSGYKESFLNLDLEERLKSVDFLNKMNFPKEDFYMR
jgi:hypothetical protein